MTAYHSTDAIKTPDGDVLTDVLGGTVEAETIVGAGGGAPAFTGSWGAAAATPLATFGPLRFYRHAGRGYISGVTKGGTAPSVVFTLPAGYCPAYIVAAIAASLSDAMAAGTATVAVGPDGSVTVFASSEANVGIIADFRLA